MTQTMKYLGITDEYNACTKCGKTNLKKTVVLEINESIEYWGTDCAAKVLYGKNDGTVLIQPVSGRNLNKMPGHKLVSKEVFNERDNDPCDSVVEWKWAANKCGWNLAGQDED